MAGEAEVFHVEETWWFDFIVIVLLVLHAFVFCTGILPYTHSDRHAQWMVCFYAIHHPAILYIVVGSGYTYIFYEWLALYFFANNPWIAFTIALGIALVLLCFTQCFRPLLFLGVWMFLVYTITRQWSNRPTDLFIAIGINFLGLILLYISRTLETIVENLLLSFETTYFMVFAMAYLSNQKYRGYFNDDSRDNDQPSDPNGDKVHDVTEAMNAEALLCRAAYHCNHLLLIVLILALVRFVVVMVALQWLKNRGTHQELEEMGGDEDPHYVIELPEIRPPSRHSSYSSLSSISLLSELSSSDDDNESTASSETTDSTVSIVFSESDDESVASSVKKE